MKSVPNLLRPVIVAAMVLPCFVALSSPAETPAAPVFRPDPALLGPGAVRPWTARPFRNNPREFQFAIIPDRTTRFRPGVFESAIEKLNLLRPEFVMSVGDLIPGYTNDAVELERQWHEVTAIIDRLESPFFHVPGNHDYHLSYPNMVVAWAKCFGPADYHFVYADVLFVCLNSGPRELQAEQVASLRRILAENTGVRWTFLFTHKPFWVEQDKSRWPEIEALLASRPHSVFAGHHHNYTKYVRNGRSYIKLATAGGDSRLLGPQYGWFDHITWVTMTETGPRVANLALDGIYDENLLTEEHAPVAELLAESRWIGTETLFADHRAFTSGTTELRLSNPTAFPLRVTGAFATHPRLHPTPNQIDLVLPANSKQVVPVLVSATSPTPVDELAPLELTCRARSEPPGVAPFERAVTRTIVLEQRYDCPRAAGPITVDGSLEDWPALALACRSPAMIEGESVYHAGSSDASFRFATAHDGAFLYLAVETTDDHAAVFSDTPPGRRDAVAIHLDARPDPDRSTGSRLWNKQLKLFLPFEITSGPTPDAPLITPGFPNDRLPAGSKAACVRTALGLRVEIAIPVAWLDEKQGGPWNAFRLNIAQLDIDDAPAPRIGIWWRPHWESPQNFLGSGTFVRK